MSKGLSNFEIEDFLKQDNNEELKKKTIWELILLIR